MENKIKISQFLDIDGNIKQLPVKRAKRIAVLAYLASQFACDTYYTEEEVGIIINEWHTFDDCCLLRRELIDNDLLCRTTNGTRYWKEKEND